jgi:hypothetical protein
MHAKKSLLIYSLTVILFLFIIQTAWAAETVSVAFDGRTIPVLNNPSSNAEYYLTGYYLPASAEIKSGRTFVPVRMISELLGAKVTWQGKSVDIAYNDVDIQLTLGSKNVQKGQQTYKLEAAPYAKAGITYVPLRFISESFGCQVDYQNKAVNIHTKPWLLNGKYVSSMMAEGKMIVEYFRHDLQSPFFAEKIYTSLINGRGDEVSEPEHFGNLDIMDYPNFYCIEMNRSLLDSAGAVIENVVVYEVAGNGFGQPLPDGYTEHLLYVNDNVSEKWYTLSEEALELADTWDDLGNWVLVEER